MCAEQTDTQQRRKNTAMPSRRNQTLALKEKQRQSKRQKKRVYKVYCMQIEYRHYIGYKKFTHPF